MNHAHAYTARELATMLGVDRKTVYIAAKLGQLPHRRLGRRIVFPKAAVDDWLANPPVAGPRVLPSSGAKHPKRSK